MPLNPVCSALYCPTRLNRIGKLFKTTKVLYGKGGNAELQLWLMVILVSFIHMQCFKQGKCQIDQNQMAHESLLTADILVGCDWVLLELLIEDLTFIWGGDHRYKRLVTELPITPATVHSRTMLLGPKVYYLAWEGKTYFIGFSSLGLDSSAVAGWNVHDLKCQFFWSSRTLQELFLHLKETETLMMGTWKNNLVG